MNNPHGGRPGNTYDTICAWCTAPSLIYKDGYCEEDYKLLVADGYLPRKTSKYTSPSHLT